MPKNKHAVALGRKGGKANTPAQQAARSANGKKGGRKPKPAFIGADYAKGEDRYTECVVQPLPNGKFVVVSVTDKTK